jgi:hypothetical protein
LRFDMGMHTHLPDLTRRRDPDANQETWRVYYGDVCVGVIAMRSGNPTTTEPWEWRCGFYPGSKPGECAYGTATTFDEARADFEAAWAVFLAKRTDADFQEWRDHRDSTAQKYAAWARGEKLPARLPSSTMRCPCGELFDSHDPAGSYQHLLARIAMTRALRHHHEPEPAPRRKRAKKYKVMRASHP